MQNNNSWKGIVTGKTKESFSADITLSDSCANMRIKFSKTEVKPSDRDKIETGVSFEWSLGDGSLTFNA